MLSDFKNVSRAFHRGLYVDSKCFLKFPRQFSRFHVAWHPSQLPEQKEGLFVAFTLVIILVRHSERRPDIARYLKKIARDRLSWLREFV